MKVILLQDVAGVGKKWEVKEVKNGYAGNYLLPRNLAVMATKGALKDIKLKQTQEAQKKAVREDLFGKSLESLRDAVLVVERKANEKGHLFDGVDAKEIAGLVEEKTKIKIPAECVNLEKAIKEVGKYKISIRKGDQEVPFEIEIKTVG